jgi:hypothetical protein
MEFKGRVISKTAIQLTAWVTGVAYQAGDCITQTGAMYLCNTAHTSGTFSTDVSTKWTAVAAASNTVIEKFIVQFTPAENIALFSTPQEIAPAPGALKTYRFIAGSHYLDHQGVDYDFPSDMKIYYETLGQVILLLPAPNDSADFIFRIDKSGASGDPMSFNDRVMIAANTGDASVGDGIWTLQLLFSVDDYN